MILLFFCVGCCCFIDGARYVIVRVVWAPISGTLPLPPALFPLERTPSVKLMFMLISHGYHEDTGSQLACVPEVRASQRHRPSCDTLCTSTHARICNSAVVYRLFVIEVPIPQRRRYKRAREHNLARMCVLGCVEHLCPQTHTRSLSLSHSVLPLLCQRCCGSGLC